MVTATTKRSSCGYDEEEQEEEGEKEEEEEEVDETGQRDAA